MKATITLDLQNTQLGETVVQTFASLTEDQRLALCKQVMLEWLRQPIEVEASERDRLAIAAYRDKGYDRVGYAGPRATDEEIRRNYRFPDILKATQTTRGAMVASIREEATKHYKSLVKTLVEEDPQTAEVKAQVEEDLRKSFPDLVRTAMVDWFGKQFQFIAPHIGGPA